MPKKQTTIASPPAAPESSAEPKDSGVLERIRVRAYELYEQRGRESGHEIEDWLAAEAEVLGKKPTAAA